MKAIRSIWPDITTIDGARIASRNAAIAAVVIAATTVFTASSPMIDTALYLLIAWRIHARSVFAAAGGMVLFLFGMIDHAMLGKLTPAMAAVAVVAIPFFANGIRGNMALKKMGAGEITSP